MLSVAVADMKLQPSEFWGLTPSEFDLLLMSTLDRQARAAGRFTRSELKELERIGREAMEKEVRDGRRN